MPKMVLIIEPDKYLRVGIAEILELGGFDVLDIEDPIEGVELAKQYLPDLIVCRNGVGSYIASPVLEALKTERTTRNIPIMLTTAYMAQNIYTRWQQRAIAPEHILRRPFDAEDLIHIARSLTEKG